ELALVVRGAVEEAEAGLDVLLPARAGVQVIEDREPFVLIERFQVRAEALHEPERPIVQAGFDAHLAAHLVRAAEQVRVVALQPAETIPEGAALGVDGEARARAGGAPVKAEKSLRDAE